MFELNFMTLRTVSSRVGCVSLHGVHADRQPTALDVDLVFRCAEATIERPCHHDTS